MTVQTDLNRKQYAGNGVTTAFATSPVVFFDETDLDVYDVVTATGAATLKTLTTDYTVSGGGGSTGTVTMLSAPASGHTLVIVRNVPLTQESDFVQNDASDAEVVEDALDKLTMADQQLSARLDRSFTLADSDVSGASLTVPTPSANKLVGWNSAGTALENKAAADIDLTTTTAFVETLLDDADGDALIATIIADQTAETSPASGDLISIVDVSLTPDDGRKMTLGNVLKVVNDLTADATPDSTADYLLSYDTSAAAAKKVLPSSLPLFTTGDVKLTLKTTADTGWVLMNDTTIGDASSGATGRANADTEALFTLLWTNTADAQCAVSTGRGASAAADFAAHKTIALPKALGRALATYGSGSGLTARALALATGNETHALSTGELPSFALHITAPANSAPGGNVNFWAGDNSGGTAGLNTDASGFAGTAHNNMQPTLFLNTMIKL